MTVFGINRIARLLLYNVNTTHTHISTSIHKATTAQTLVQRTYMCVCDRPHVWKPTYQRRTFSAHGLKPRIPWITTFNYKVHSLYNHSVGRCSTPSGIMRLTHTKPQHMGCLWSATTELPAWVSLEHSCFVPRILPHTKYSFFMVA